MFSAIRQFFQNRKIKSLITNWHIPRPEYLWIAAKPNQEARQIPISEAETILGIHWTEVFLANKNQFNRLRYFLGSSENFPVLSQEESLACLKEFTENCVIRWLDDEIGWVLTLRPGKTISKGFVSCYTGMLNIKKFHQKSSYAEREFFFSILKTDKEDILVDAKNHGNIARFLPFLLEEKYLENFDIDSRIQNKIAVANLEFGFVLIDGMKLPCVYAPSDITAPEDRELLLGVNYSLQYLCKMYQTNRIFKLIDKNSLSPLDPVLYPQKMIEVKLQGLSYSFQVSRFRILLGKSLPDLSYRTMGKDEEKNEYFEITVSDADIYNALMQSPDAKSITVVPTIKPIT